MIVIHETIGAKIGILAFETSVSGTLNGECPTSITSDIVDWNLHTFHQNDWDFFKLAFGSNLLD